RGEPRDVTNTSRWSGRFQRLLTLCSGFGALAALAANLDNRARRGKSCVLGRFAHAACQRIVIDVHGLSAIVADEENAIVQAAGVLVGDIGIGALDAPGEIGADEQ